MKTLTAILAFTAAILQCGCGTGFAPKPLLQKTLVLAYDDFGPEALVAPWLGPREPAARIVVHYSQSETALRGRHPGPEHRFVSVRNALFHVGRVLRQLPDGAPQRPRVRATFAVLRAFEQDRRTALNASPPFAGRGALRRMAITH